MKSDPQPVLLSRLSPPQSGEGIVTRQRLQLMLDSAGSYALTLITAPTGYGKSTLLAEWAKNKAGAIAWFTLENTDNDPVIFWRYVVTTLQKTLPVLPIAEFLTAPQLGKTVQQNNLDALCNAIAGFSQPVYLILDDFQHITHADILDSLVYLIQHQPANFHLIIASRALPALPLARLKVKNRLYEIKTGQLAFTADEAFSFFKANQKQLPSAEQIKGLIDLSEGWPAALRLMVLSANEGEEVLDNWHAGHQQAVEYLADEILELLPEKQLNFLQKAATFEEFNLDMLLYITEEPQAARWLDICLQNSLFIQHSQGFYRFLAFFREALLQKNSDPENYHLNQRAAAWYEQHARPEKALTHTALMKDWQHTADLVQSIAADKLQKGEFHSLKNFINLIPPEIQKNFPDILIIQAWIAYLCGDISDALTILEQLASETARAKMQKIGWLDGLHCQMALVQEDNRRALNLAQQALNNTPENDLFIRGLLLTALATAQQALGESQAAVQSYQKAIEVNRQVGNLLMSLFALASLAIELNNRGERLQALILCDESLEEAGESADLPGTTTGNPLYGLIDLMRARLLCDANRLEEASFALVKGKEKLTHLGLSSLLISCDLTDVQILVARDQHAEALTLINKNLRKVRSAEMVGFRRLFELYKAELYYQMGQSAVTKNWLENASLPETPQQDPAREMEFVFKARYLVENGHVDEAGQLLEHLNNYAQQNQHLYVLIAVYFIRANLEWKKGEPGQVRFYLEKALALAGPQNYQRLILDYGAPLLGLIAQMPGAPLEIREHFRSSSNPVVVTGLIDMLTAREMDVLNLLAENRTNAEIAQQLVLSNETIKIHLKHIFQKLDVSDRRQAVSRARQMGLI
ncbi:MAG: LuxR C-terminal-related transcriptional regulator [Anaerolineae bacterium]|nr:LuxR C-terminal-related transcriptional regulator [Anaerolineae bacterium]